MMFVPQMQDLSFLGQLELFNFDKLDSGQTQVTDSLYTKVCESLYQNHRPII